MTLRFAAIALAAALPAAAAPVPAAEQAALLFKVLTADRNFAPRGADVAVGVVYESASPVSREAAGRFAAEVRRRAAAGEVPRARVSLVDASASGALAPRLEGADVLWVAPCEKLDLGEVARVAREKRIRTAGSSAALAEAGLGVAFEERQGAPGVVVNLEAARAEGADFSAKLLKVARRVGR